MKFLAVLMLLSQVAFSEFSMTNTGNSGTTPGGAPKPQEKGYPAGKEKKHEEPLPPPPKYTPPPPVINDKWDAWQNQPIENIQAEQFSIKSEEFYREYAWQSSQYEDSSLFHIASNSGCDFRRDNCHKLSRLAEHSTELISEYAADEDLEAAEISYQIHKRLSFYLKNRHRDNFKFVGGTDCNHLTGNKAAKQWDMHDDVIRYCNDFFQGVFNISPLGWISDVYESTSGKNFWNDKPISELERGIATIGAVSFGLGNKPLKALKVFQRLGRIRPLTYDAYKSMFNGKSLSEVKEIYIYFKKYGHKLEGPAKSYLPANEDGFRVLTRTFEMKSVERATTKKGGMDVLRYAGDKANPRGNFLTLERLKNPKAELALPNPVKPEPYKWHLPEGQEYLKGRAAPEFGEPGGAVQIFIADPGVLK